MNWPVLAFVFPSAALLIVAHILTLHYISLMSDDEKRTVWADLRRPCVRYAWGTTFALASFGCIGSFVLFLSKDKPEYAWPSIMFIWNASYIVFDYALLYNMKRLVLAARVVNVGTAMGNFIYTAYVFDLAATGFPMLFVLATHAGNSIAVLHVTIFDLVIWYDSWLEYRAILHEQSAFQTTAQNTRLDLSI
jgi:hypothetical protein